MTNEIRKVLVDALKAYKGDDYYQARLRFGGYSNASMEEQHGQSGRTRREVLQRLRDREAEINEVIDRVKLMP